MLKIFWAILWIGALHSAAWGQDVQLNESPAVSQLMRAWVNDNRTNPGIPGWRIQLTSTTDRQQAEDFRNNFRLQFPDIPAETVHEKPYYKVRAGAYRTRQEAVAALAGLTGFSGAYPARDPKIHPRHFLSQ